MDSELLRTLPFRRVDLVADFAARELFAINADALLVELSVNASADSRLPLVPAHLIYLFETFLCRLNVRGCKYDLVFFDCQSLALLSDLQKPAVQIVRECLMKSLKFHTDLRLLRHASWTDEAWVRYLEEEAPSFVLTSDGSIQFERMTESDEFNAELEAGAFANSSVFRIFILDCLSKATPVALLVGLEWLSAGVEAYGCCEPISIFQPLQTAHFPSVGFWKESLLPSLGLGENLRIRMSIAVSACILKKSQQPNKLFFKAFLLHSSLLALIPLKLRCPILDWRVSRDAIRFFQECCFEMLPFLSSVSACPPLDDSWSFFADPIDPLMFFRVLSCLSKDTSWVDSNLVEGLERWLNATEALAEKTFPKDEVVQSVGEGFAASTLANFDGHLNPLIPTRYFRPFSSGVLDEFFKGSEVVWKLSGNEEQPPPKSLLKLDKARWRSTAPLVTADEKLAVSSQLAPEASDWRAMRAEQKMAGFLHKYAQSLEGSRILHRTIVISEPKSALASSKPSAKVPKQSKKALEIIAKQAEEKAKESLKKEESRLKDMVQQAKAEKDQFKAFKELRRLTKDVFEHPLSALAAEQHCVEFAIDAYRHAPKDHCLLEGAKAYLVIVEAVHKFKEYLSKDPKQLKNFIKSLEKLHLGDAAFAFLKDLNVDSASFKQTKLEQEARMSYQRLQLCYIGHELERDVDPIKDERVMFTPDRWQKELLDIVDKRESVLAVAPTSAGKTFVAFYAIEQVLREGEDGVVVYVAPTKALVNQIAAEIYARFGGHKYKNPNRVLVGLWTRDYRHYATRGQVLVTVPQILEILLVSPLKANMDWAKRVRYVIFDEIHCIGERENGAVWEHLLLLISSPFLALSATISNPEELHQWLVRSQEVHKRKVQLVKHAHRWSDLRKHIFLPSSSEIISLRTIGTWPIQQKNPSAPRRLSIPDPLKNLTLTPTELGGVMGLFHLHPCSVLSEKKLRATGYPEDLTLSPEECVQLYDACQTVLGLLANNPNAAGQTFEPVEWKRLEEELQSFSIEKFFEGEWRITRRRVRQYEQRLRTFLKDHCEVVGLVASSLAQNWMPRWLEMTKQKPESEVSSDATPDVKPDVLVRRLSTTKQRRLKCFLPLCCLLSSMDLLPTIVFVFDREMCEQLAIHALLELEEEETWRRTQSPEGSAAYNAKLDRIMEQQKIEAKRRDALDKKKGKDKDSAEPDKETSTGTEDANSPDLDLTFLTRATESAARKEIETFMKDRKFQMEMARVCNSELLQHALLRGIGVHHAGMPRKYLEAVEVLFRMRILKVVVATGTLALGINMPCRSTIFYGDSAYLNSLQFRQMSGRAGRRGFDPVGHVIFFDISPAKITHLLTSSVPRLQGHFPLTNTLILRLLHLFSAGADQVYSKRIILNVLKQPFFILGQDKQMSQVVRHVRFSLEYLQAIEVVSSSGQVALVGRLIYLLHYHEPGNFGFAFLLGRGIFDRICADKVPTRDALLKVLLILCHLFGIKVSLKSITKPVLHGDTLSRVQLPLLPDFVDSELKLHNLLVLAIFTNYARDVATLLDLDAVPNCSLPITRVKLPVSQEHQTSIPLAMDKMMSTAMTFVARSPFSALSGRGDIFDSALDLTLSVRDGVHLDPTAVPTVPLASTMAMDSRCFLNGYLYEFFRHGQQDLLVNENGISSGEVFSLLKDFVSTLKVISRCMHEMAGKGNRVAMIFALLSKEFSGKFRAAYKLKPEQADEDEDAGEGSESSEDEANQDKGAPAGPKTGPNVVQADASEWDA